MIRLGIGYRDKFNDFFLKKEVFRIRFLFSICNFTYTVVFSSQFHFRRELKLFDNFLYQNKAG